MNSPRKGVFISTATETSRSDLSGGTSPQGYPRSSCHRADIGSGRIEDLRRQMRQ